MNLGANMKLLIAGLAGVVVASLVFTSIVALPMRRQTATSTSSTYLYGTMLPSPVTVSLFLSNLTQQSGVGSKYELTLVATSNISLSNVTLHIDLSKAEWEWASQGIELVSGDSTWTVNLVANVPVILHAIINATEIGYGKIEATATWPDSTKYSLAWDAIGIEVLQSKVLTYTLEVPPGMLPPVRPPELDSGPGFIPAGVYPSDVNFTLPYP